MHEHTAQGPVSRWLSTAQPEALFVLSAVAQYAGAAIAVLLFDQVEPQTVGWFRIIGAAIALLAVSTSWWRGWTRQQLVGVALFGVATSLMNIFFYLAINRIDLGKSVTIEFIGPIAVAAAMTRTRRNAVALLFAIFGVAILGGVEVDENAIGLVYILIASALWAAYIVIGSKVARVDRGVAGLGLGLAIGAVVTIPFGAPWSGPVWVSPTLLALCLVVGVFSNAIGYGIDQFTMRRIPIRRFSLLLALLPVTASFIGWIALDQAPSPIDLVGIALVLVAVSVQERDEIERVEATVLTDPA
ncbi:MAG: EamA family transporter [Ilumatobacter sp.]|uniref:EamA family transporter n=1 Tax=Ilumatobacter sp. TaxID=1967498 RepID=UPI00391D02E1